MIQKATNFLSCAFSICAIVLFIIFSSFRSAPVVGFSVEKKSGIYSLASPADDISLSNAPVTVPSPAVSPGKGQSSRAGFTSKFILRNPDFLRESFSAFYKCLKTELHVQPMRLHLTLRVLRI